MRTKSIRICTWKPGTIWCLVAMCLLVYSQKLLASNGYTQKTTLPTIYIETYDEQDVTDHDNYKYCRIIYINGADTSRYDSVKIRGRGNTTWTLPKKPYRIKFPSKTRLLGKGEAKAKDWYCSPMQETSYCYAMPWHPEWAKLCKCLSAPATSLRTYI